MSGDLIYEMLRIIGYVDMQKEIDRIHTGFATLDEKHALIHKLRAGCCAPKREVFKNNSDYDAAKARYDILKEQLRDLRHNYDTDSETSELAKLAKEIRSETVQKPVEPVKSNAIANPNLNKDKFRPEDFPRNAGNQ